MMRKIKDAQIRLGAVEISQIKFDLRSRDEIPRLLMGLQYIYCTRKVKEEVFKIPDQLRFVRSHLPTLSQSDNDSRV